jgi:riboflavin biosynthesis protein RibD
VTAADAGHMRRALELASQAHGATHPNPAVGEGYHPKAGLPHAEVYALRAAGQAAQGGTAYVTLEPCNHYGKTPPCALALIDAELARVVVGIIDPNPLVGGMGVDRLRNAGIAVAVGCEEEKCFAMNADWMQKMAASGKQ